MLVHVRLSDCSKSVRLEVSRLIKVEELRKLLQEEFQVEPERQRLFYGGKQFVDGYTVFDYGVTSNNIVTLMIKPILEASKGKENENDRETNNLNKQEEKTSNSNNQDEHYEVESVTESQFFKVNDSIDICDNASGSWFEAKIVKITKMGIKHVYREPSLFDDVIDLEDLENEDRTNWLERNVDTNGFVLLNRDDGYTYHSVYSGYEEFSPEETKIWTFRPRAWKKIGYDKVLIGDRVLANYNIEEPKKRGFFFDCTVTAKSHERGSRYLIVTVHIGLTNNHLENCKIKFVDELFSIEKTVRLSDRSLELERRLQSKSIPIRLVKPQCDFCKDRKSEKCKECSCKICGGKQHPDRQILCDECNGSFHFYCLDPPIYDAPANDDWFCSECKNDATEIVGAGEKLKTSKKKAKMASTNSKSSRDWGKGMACVGREKICTIVPSNHFGPIPGIEVGSSWKYRVQVSSDGVHRPHVAGIHGANKNGAFSLVLSGGYEDDVDNGDEFKYTGSGGRDLSGNKRTAKQSFDQALTKCNLGLAASCNASINENGATAKDWQKGKPVRVLRSAKLQKHSRYAPEEGFRYDGIYKVVKYWPEKGQSGFKVWRYLLRRDDPTPAPWTKEGKKRIKELGLTMKYPEGYEENEKNGKRSSPDEDDCVNNSSKRSKSVNFKLSDSVESLIKKDVPNETLWNECLAMVPNGIQKFNETVNVNFMCICCQDLLYKPVTTICKHNFCLSCLTRACETLNNSCPACRMDLGAHPDFKINVLLRDILKSLFRGYENGRE